MEYEKATTIPMQLTQRTKAILITTAAIVALSGIFFIVYFFYPNKEKPNNDPSPTPTDSLNPTDDVDPEKLHVVMPSDFIFESIKSEKVGNIEQLQKFLNKVSRKSSVDISSEVDIQNLTTVINGKHDFFKKTLPKIKNQALKLKGEKIELRKQNNDSVLEYDSDKIASILSLCCLGAFGEQSGSFSQCSMIPMFSGSKASNDEKIKMWINYFDTLEENSVRKIKFQRFKATDLEESLKDKNICGLELGNVKIEDNVDCLQAVFANKKLGGGVFKDGNQQEEIRFSISNELAALVLFMEEMRDDEVIRISGVKRYSDYEGDADSLKFTAKSAKFSDKDSDVVAFEAVNYSSNYVEQFNRSSIEKDLLKATTAFRVLEKDTKKIATGDWGCGDFLGSKYLKFAIQLIAASANGRNLVYTSADENLKKIYEHFVSQKFSLPVLKELLITKLEDLKSGLNTPNYEDREKLILETFLKFEAVKVSAVKKPESHSFSVYEKKVTSSAEISAALKGVSIHGSDVFNGLDDALVDMKIDKKIYQKMFALALLLKDFEIPVLKQFDTRIVTFTQKQVASILVHIFFGTFPSRESTFPGLKMDKKLQKGSSYEYEFLKMFLHYFDRVTADDADLSHEVTFQRVCFKDPNEMEKLINENPLLDIDFSKTLIEDKKDALQADFANKMIGGGVLSGCPVQEEIRFTISTEMIASLVFMEVMDDKEAIIIRGAQQYSKVKGYGSSLKYDGDHKDTLSVKPGTKILDVDLVAFDATSFGSFTSQLTVESYKRELYKAMIAFKPQTGADKTKPIATGHWGCGVFLGNPFLKLVVQEIASSAFGRKMHYTDFGNQPDFDSNKKKLIQYMKGKTVQQLHQIVLLVLQKKIEAIPVTNFLHELIKEIPTK